jgi:hypothetical protein
MGNAARYALSFAQGIMSLFAAGTIVYEAHRLFLWYYAREMVGIQLSGVNGCAGEDLVANGDLFSGKTFCNGPENLVPWIEIYRHHPPAAAAYYGSLLFILGLIAAIAARLIFGFRHDLMPDKAPVAGAVARSGSASAYAASFTFGSRRTISPEGSGSALN